MTKSPRPIDLVVEYVTPCRHQTGGCPQCDPPRPIVPLPVDIAWIDDNDGCGPRKLQNSIRCF